MRAACPIARWQRNRGGFQPVDRFELFTYSRLMRVALVQINSSSDISSNIKLVERYTREAADRGAELVVFPEAMSQAFETGRLDTQAEELDGEFAGAARSIADECGVVVVAGMFCPADTVDREGQTIQRVYNTALVTGRGLHSAYHKIHTYDAFGFTESDTVRPGTDLVAVDMPLADGSRLRLGLAICFDIRFPDQFVALARDKEAQVIVVPTSWHDGENKLAQWRCLTLARALDSTCFILAADQARPGGESRAGRNDGPTGIGYSQAIAPDGTRIAEGGYGEDVIYADLDLELLDDARSIIPVLSNTCHWEK